MKNLFLSLAIFFGLFLIIGIFLPTQASAHNFANIWAGRVTPGSGHIGIDIWWPDHGESQYNPCHKHKDAQGNVINDTYYGACIMSNVDRTSYYKVGHFGPFWNSSNLPGWSTTTLTDFPYGIFIDNTNENYCRTAPWCPNPSATTIHHGWANLVTGAAMEIYPYSANNTYDPYTSNVGGVRINLNGFPTIANGGRYSVQVGNVSLPQLGQPNVGKLNGFIKVNSTTPAANDRVNISAFQNGATRYTSTGVGMSGFSSVNNKSASNDGYYNIGAVPSGKYKLYVHDLQANRKIILDNVNINLPYERLDFRLDQHCFGHPEFVCTDPAN